MSWITLEFERERERERESLTECKNRGDPYEGRNGAFSEISYINLADLKVAESTKIEYQK